MPQEAIQKHQDAQLVQKEPNEHKQENNKMVEDESNSAQESPKKPQYHPTKVAESTRESLRKAGRSYKKS